MSSVTNSLGYQRKPVAASSLDVGSLSKLNNWQMSIYTPSSIPKPPSNSYTAFFDSTNSNKLSVKDSSGAVTLIGGISINGDFQALVGPTETYTSVQAAVTAGFWRLRITGTFTEPGAISFAALSLNPDILISIDQGVTWTTANIITYTGGGNITFTGGGTFKYTIGSSGVIVLTAGKRVTFDTCNITNAASVNTCRLASSTTDVFIVNSLITVPDKVGSLINSTTSFLYMDECTFTGGGANARNIIVITFAMLCNMRDSILAESFFDLLTLRGGIHDNISIIGDPRCTSCLMSNVTLIVTALNYGLSLDDGAITNINAPGCYFSSNTTLTSICNSISDLAIASVKSLTVNASVGFVQAFNSNINMSNSQLVAIDHSIGTWSDGHFDNCYLGNGSAISIDNLSSNFTNCTFSGNITTGTGNNVHLDNCKIIGTLTIGSGSNHKVSNTVVTSSIAVTGSQAQISNSRCTSMTVNAAQCIVTKCVLSSTLSIGSSASAQGSIFSNNVVTSTTSTDGSVRSDDLVFTGNNLIGTVTVSAGATANHEPLFFGNKIGAGGATATGPGSSHANSGNNSRP